MIFIDTWGWITVSTKREARHQEVADFLDNFWRRGGINSTSDYVLDETITLLFRWLPFGAHQSGALRASETATLEIARQALDFLH